MALTRVPEPECMDTFEEAVQYDLMDHSEVNRAFVDRFLAIGGGGHVLDVGTGPAHIPIELCRRREDVRVTAVDAARAMLDRAAIRVREAGLAGRVRLSLADGKRLLFPDGSFDSVMSNSIVHHLPDPRPFFREAGRLVKPGGVVFLRDLFRPETESELAGLVARHTAGATEAQRSLFAASLRAAFTVAEVRSMLAECGLSGLSVAATSDRHWTAERGSSPLRP